MAPFGSCCQSRLISGDFLCWSVVVTATVFILAAAETYSFVFLFFFFSIWLDMAHPQHLGEKQACKWTHRDTQVACGLLLRVLLIHHPARVTGFVGMGVSQQSLNAASATSAPAWWTAVAARCNLASLVFMAIKNRLIRTMFDLVQVWRVIFALMSRLTSETPSEWH